MGSNAILENFLSVYWLRPETALWRSIDVRVMAPFDFASPSLDLGCGDGMFSFIRSGGIVNIEFDVFKSVNNLESFFDKVDVFNHCDDSIVKPTILSEPKYKIDYGLDHKSSLLSKASMLGLYNNTVVANANEKLPFTDNYFKSIFSNIIYWLDNPKVIFNEIYRVLDNAGQCCVMLPNDTFPAYSFYYDLVIRQGKKEYAFLELLDRGRMSDNVKHAKSYKEWKDIIENANLRIAYHKMYLSKATIQFWDIGLRPIFPLIHSLISSIDNERVISIKKQWINTFMMFLEPLSLLDSNFNPEYEPAFHCFILEK